MALYGLFSWLDYGIYSMVKFMMKLIILLGNYNFFNETQIGDLADKVYVVLGVLVLFKIIISCIQFMVNPDTFDDKEKGMGGILKKTVICMALLVVVRPVFNFALTIQQTVVATVPSLVMGTGSSDFTVASNNARDELDKIGDLIAGTTLKAFVSIRTDDNGNPIASDKMEATLDSFSRNVQNGCNKGGAISKYITTSQCDYSYMWGISTAAGIFLFYILVSMTVDVGIRAIKLGIIQILAPIPISSYIVSKDKLSKFVKLSVKVYLDLFIRLIVVYFIIFFVKNVITTMTGSVSLIGGYQTDTSEQIFIKVIIIIALFLFAKNAPKFICDVLGIEGGGFGDLKDMFTRGSGLLGTTAAGLRTARSNWTAQKERALGKGKGFWGQRAAALKGAVAGFSSATGRGMLMAAQGKGFKDVRMGASKAAINARNRRNSRLDKLYNRNSLKDILKGTRTVRTQYAKDANGNKIERKVLSKIPGIRNFQWAKYQKEKNPEYYGWWDYRRDVSREKREIPSSAGFVKSRYDAMESIGKMAADAKGHGVAKMNETPDRFKVSLSTLGTAGASIQTALGFNELTMEQVRNMYQMAKNGQSVKDSSGNDHHFTDAEITNLGSLVQNIEKRTSYLKEAELMATGDPAAAPNAEKIRIGIQTNKDLFNSTAILNPIREKMVKDIGDTITIDGKDIDVKSLDYAGLLKITEHLQDSIPYAEGTDEYNEVVKERANILLGLKDAFEEVSKTQYRPAQLADNRAQKAQQAINNNNEKKG